MHGRTNALRFLSLIILTGLFGLTLSDLSDAAEQKDNAKKDAPKVKPVAVAAAVARTSGSKLDHTAVAKLIDEQVNERIKAEKVEPSDRSDDAEFLRRAYLDIVGRIPTAAQAAAFLDSTDSNKRAKLVDELLASPDYGRHMADIWQALLLPRNSDNRRLESAPMVSWLEEGFNTNKPWNTMVHELITASGSADKNGAVTYFVAQGTVDKMTDNVTKVFLGVQLQCAQCHNHPFTDWKQTEYWGMAAFFMKVQASRPNQAAKQGVSVTVEEVDRAKRGKNALPESAKILPPKYLGAEEPKVAATGPVRPTLANWMTTAKNPFFGKAMVNRMWAQLMGRGLVNPIDDMHDGNAPSHPQLLAELAEQFSANNFDVKYLIRAICNSEAYQRTSRLNASNKEASPAIYSRMAVKVMTGEQLVDSITQVVGPAGKGTERPAKGAAGKAGPNNQRSQLVSIFTGEDGADATEYQDGIPQVLRLMNNAALSRSPKLMELVRTSKTPEYAVEQIYLSTVSRRPTTEEMEKLTAYVKKNGAAEAYGDILWALLNSSEFRVIR